MGRLPVRPEVVRSSSLSSSGQAHYEVPEERGGWSVSEAVGTPTQVAEQITQLHTSGRLVSSTGSAD